MLKDCHYGLSDGFVIVDAIDWLSLEALFFFLAGGSVLHVSHEFLVGNAYLIPQKILAANHRGFDRRP